MSAEQNAPAAGRRRPADQARLEIETRSPEETRALGERLAAALRPGDVLLLDGPFGAGKTVLVQGLARGLGSRDEVLSPSFVIATRYRGRLPLYHVDLYRVERPEEALLSEIEELFEAGGVTVVEWPLHLPAELRAGATLVRLTPTGDQTRRIEIESPERRIVDAARKAHAAGD